MSGPAPVSLTAVRMGKAVLRPAPTPQTAPQTAPPPSAPPEDKLQARARLLVVFAQTLGHPSTQNDAALALAQACAGAAPTAPISMAQMAQALGHLGVEATHSHAPDIHAGLWPALARMSGGQYVLVMAQEQNTLVLHDPSCRDQKAHVPLAEFAPYFTGDLLTAPIAAPQLADKTTTLQAAPHWFWGAFFSHRRAFAEVALGSLVANVLAVSVALFSLQVYDRVIPHQSQATLWVLAAGAFLALSLEALLKIARAQLIDGAGRQIELSVQTLLMRRVLGMRADAPGRAPSQIFSSIREFGAVREFFTASTVSSLADIPFVFIFLALVATIAGNVVWVLVLGGVLMVLPGYFLQKHMLRLTQETQGAGVQAARLLHEAVADPETVKTQRAEARVLRLWGDMSALSADKASQQRRLASSLTYVSQALQQATYVFAVILGAYMVFAGEFTVGAIIATGILTSRTLGPLTQLAATMARWSNVKHALDGLDHIAQSPQDQADDRSYLRRDTLAGSFELREVKFRYDRDSAAALDVPGLIIPAGQRVAVLGVNGSGKSSLLKLLCGLYAPESGTVLIDGTDMAQIDPRDLRRLVGYVGQDVRLFSGSLRDNLNLTMVERDDERLMAALDFAGLGQFLRAHPKGLDLEIRDGGVGLSVGQRQSIGWARLWLQNPPICLLDEPTAALDQTLETTLVSRLHGWLEGRTAIIATHRVPILALTERTLILHAGRLAVDGPREQVLAQLARQKEGA